MRDDTVANAEAYNYKRLEMAWDHKKLSIDLRSKFELYFTALIFTLLGLAIQTAQKASSNLLNYVEVLGWILLLFSGMAGLFLLAKFWRKEMAIAEVKELAVSGVVGRDKIDEISKMIENFDFWNKAKILFFVIGMILLMISRSAKFINY